MTNLCSIATLRESAKRSNVREAQRPIENAGRRNPDLIHSQKGVEEEPIGLMKGES